jgi:hypothetical protein
MRGAVACKATPLLVWLWILAPCGTAQKGAPPAAADPFIAAIKLIEQSTISMDCLAVGGAKAKILKRIGSAFLVSEFGDFLTAAHVVLDMQKADDSCPTPAVTLPLGGWRPEAPTEDMLWFPFKSSGCKVDNSNDVAECRSSEDLPGRARELSLKIAPVQFASNTPPDGAQIAFTGFPLEARDPMTFRAHVAAYRRPWANQLTPELVIDHASLPGFSGSPVFLADGKVVAILVRDGKPEASGTSIARPFSAFRTLLGGRRE